MIAGWELPTAADFGGKAYPFFCDFRDILEIFSYFSDPDMPLFLKWRIALALFYRDPIPPEWEPEAIQYLATFINGGKTESRGNAQPLLDWEKDCELIVADINKTAGQEIRALPFLHWWTFLSWFHAIGEGQLSTVVSIRSKLAKGKKLEGWETEFYRDNRQLVELPKRYSSEEQQQRRQIEKML